MIAYLGWRQAITPNVTIHLERPLPKDVVITVRTYAIRDKKGLVSYRSILEVTP